MHREVMSLNLLVFNFSVVFKKICKLWLNLVNFYTLLKPLLLTGVKY
jgi:hypothetical protein